MQESNNNFIRSQLQFFIQLPPNTDVHFSKTHNSFIVTGGTFAQFPGVQSVANAYKGHDEKALTRKFNQLTRELFSAINEQLASSQADQRAKIMAAREIQSLKEDFECAVSGCVPEGGLLGLSKIHEVQVNQFIKRNRAIFSHAQRIIRGEPLNEKSELDADKLRIHDTENLMKSISEDEASSHIGKLLSSQLLKSMHEEQESQPGYCKVGLYKVSLLYNAVMNVMKNGWDWWNEIPLPNSMSKIYLGALPLSRKYPGTSTPSSNDLETLTREHHIGAVLSVVEPFEMETDGYLSPIRAQQWQEAGVEHKQLPTEDFKTMSYESIEEGVEFLHKCVQENIPVYIHCKAGRGRSALVLTCYLIKHHNFTAEGAIAYIKKYRPQAGLEKAKMDSAEAYENRAIFDFVNADLERKRKGKLKQT